MPAVHGTTPARVARLTAQRRRPRHRRWCHLEPDQLLSENASSDRAAPVTAAGCRGVRSSGRPAAAGTLDRRWPKDSCERRPLRRHPMGTPMGTGGRSDGAPTLKRPETVVGAPQRDPVAKQAPSPGRAKEVVIQSEWSPVAPGNRSRNRHGSFLRRRGHSGPSHHQLQRAPREKPAAECAPGTVHSDNLQRRTGEQREWRL